MVLLEVDAVARALGWVGAATGVLALGWKVWEFAMGREVVRVAGAWGEDSLNFDGIPPWPAFVITVRNIGGAPVDIHEVYVELPGHRRCETDSRLRLPLRLDRGSREQFAVRESALTVDDIPVNRVRPAVELATGRVVRGRWTAVRR